MVTKTPKGRVLTSKGRAMLDKVAKDVFASVSQDNKALARYA